MTRTVGVDLDRPSIEQSQANGTHHEYIVMDVMDIGRVFSERSFDAVLASDLIEHLPKADGNRLIEMMEGIAAKRVIIFTPNGFVPQNADDHNQQQVHLSGWTADEMRMRGYDVIGVNGLKQLRGERAQVRWKPRLVWRTISLLSQHLTTRRPERAFSILCVKQIPETVDPQQSRSTNVIGRSDASEPV